MNVKPSERPGATSRPTITRLIAEGVLDSELAGLIWLLMSVDLPMVVSGDPDADPAQLAQSLDGLVEVITATNGSGPRRLWLLEENSLEHVFSRLAGPPTNLDEDQLRSLGIVLIVRMVQGRGRRLVAAHYVRPIERDAAGHLQRRPPAVLAAWEEREDRLEHYAWAIGAELAERLGISGAEFDQAHRRRESLLQRLVDAAELGSDELGRAVGELLAAERH